MYSKQHACIFVHQRKAAGTSIKTLFADAEPDFNDGVLDPRWRAGDPRVQSCFKFTVVRNPWDRFVSGWRYLKSTRHRSIEDVLLNLPQERLLDNILGSASFAARRAYTAELWRRTRDRSAARIRMSVTGHALKMPHDQGHDYRHITRQQYLSVTGIDGRLAVDAVFFTEAMDEGLAFLEGKAGISPVTMRSVNRRRVDDDYRRHFNTRTLELFNRLFATDVAFWGYDFEAGPGVPPGRCLIEQARELQVPREPE